MALGHGERCLIARSSPVAAKRRIWWSSLCERAVPNPEMLLPQQSSSAGGSSQAPTRFIRFRHRPCESNASRRNLKLSIARLRHRRCTASFPGGNAEHSGHVVGAVAVLGPGLAEEGVLERAAFVGHGEEVAEVRLESLGRHAHTSASRSVSEAIRHVQVLTRHHRPAETRCEPRCFGGHLGGELGPGEDPPEGARHCIGVVVVDHQSGTAREQFNGVRKGRRYHWSSGRNGIDEDAGSDLVFGVVGQDDHRA